MLSPDHSFHIFTYCSKYCISVIILNLEISKLAARGNYNDSTWLLKDLIMSSISGIQLMRPLHWVPGPTHIIRGSHHPSHIFFISYYGKSNRMTWKTQRWTGTELVMLAEELTVGLSKTYKKPGNASSPWLSPLINK